MKNLKLSLDDSQIRGLIRAKREGREAEVLAKFKATGQSGAAVVQVRQWERSENLKKVAAGYTADLQAFFRAAWEVLEPTKILHWSWHYAYLAEWLTLI